MNDRLLKAGNLRFKFKFFGNFVIQNEGFLGLIKNPKFYFFFKKLLNFIYNPEKQ